MNRIKSYITISLLIIFTQVAWADKATKNNYSGSWTDNNSWVGGTAPPTLNLPIPAENYTINGYIYAASPSNPQPFSFNGGYDSYTITIVDTLIIYGDVDFANKSMNLDIQSGGLLIIFGDMVMTNKINVATNGQIIVTGEFNAQGSQGDYSGLGNVYAGSYSGHGSDMVPDGQEKNTGSDLQNDFPDIYEFVNEGGVSALPVKILKFNYSKSGNGIQLNWLTSYEHNFNYFTIERAGKDLVFVEIGRVYAEDGESNTSKRYEFTDEMPLHGMSYYRLKSTDFNGESEYHGILAVNETDLNNILKIFPNPSPGNKTTIEYSADNDNNFRIISMSGDLVETGKIKPGINDIYFHRYLSPGVYLIYLDDDQMVSPAKLVIR